jgi:hypothetical protein
MQSTRAQLLCNLRKLFGKYVFSSASHSLALKKRPESDEAGSVKLMWVRLATSTMRTSAKKMHTSETSERKFLQIPQTQHNRSDINHGPVHR